MGRLQERLDQAAAASRGVLVGYLPAGYPTPDLFTASARAAFTAGLDALEVGLPGPVPDLDGPVIQRACLDAAQWGLDVPAALRLAAAARHDPADPLIALAYRATADERGVPALLDSLVEGDADALLLPEHSLADQLDVAQQASAGGVDSVLFLYREEDLGLISGCDLDRPIIYLQSADLRTGGRFNADKALERLGELNDAMGGRAYRVLVGFGVRGPDEVRTVVRAGADGAIIGTRLVAAAGESPDELGRQVAAAVPALADRGADSVRRGGVGGAVGGYAR
ncbi:tryptophan synthase subunit alpha [Enemella dayhoffiae]|nr:tryptophan synthase subunit alpha [Enemella dayhoffiae]